MPRTAIYITPEDKAAAHRERCRRYRERHPDRVRESSKKDYEKHKDQKAAYAKVYSADPKNKNRILATSRRHEASEKRKAHKKEYYARVGETRNAKIREYQKINKEYLYTKTLEWRKNNPGNMKAIAARARASRELRFCGWANQEKINDIYKQCPASMSVDHIIPLKGKFISGLHIETNLQYLDKIENLKKNNKYEPRYLTSEELDEINRRMNLFFIK